MNKISTTVLFDMRAPDFGPSASTLYPAALEMAAFADEIGVDTVNVMEHHGSDDGYLPAPFVMGGAVAAVTKRCAVRLGAVVLPLHDPVKIAEQMAVLDLISDGRLKIIFAAGYVRSEFEMFDVSLRDRARLMDEGLDIIVRALTGERFEAGGREIFVRPLPRQAPQDMIMVGGGVEASAKRAARFGLGFSPARPGLFELYDAECAKHGFPTREKQGGNKGAISIHLTDDPEAEWVKLLPHFKYMIGEYARLADDDGAGANSSPFRGLLEDDGAIKASGLFLVVTPDQLLERARAIVGDHGSLNFMPLIGGLSPELGWQNLHLLQKLIPRLRNVGVA